MSEIITESQARIKLAQDLNKVVKGLYKDISNEEVNLDPNLSNIPATTLKDFWIYTTGFMGIQNLDDINNNYLESEANEILNGNFKLKDLTLEQATALAENAGQSINKKGQYSSVIPLYKIQDGKYSIYKNVAGNREKSKAFLSLTTSPIEFYTDLKPEQIIPSKVLQSIRNVFAHRTPYIKDSKLTFVKGNDEIVVSKMWLRGYAELFAKLSNSLDSNELSNTIKETCDQQNFTLSNQNEIGIALASIKKYFNEEAQKNYIKTVKFVFNRLSYDKNFFEKPLEDKIKTLATICAHNVDYIQEGEGSINPAIIYNIQQLVSKELEKREEFDEIQDVNGTLKTMQDLLARSKELDEEIKRFKENFGNNVSRFALIKAKDLQQKEQKLRREMQAVISTVNRNRKLASSHMLLYNYQDLQNLSVETAFNLMVLLGYNNLATSAFYEDVLRNTDFRYLTPEQEVFFNQIDMSKLNRLDLRTNKPKTNINYPSQKGFTLLALRESLIHGNVFYKLPEGVTKENADFKNIVVTFKANRQNLHISATLQDFIDLFSDNLFVKERTEDVLTNTQHILLDDIQETFSEEKIKSKKANQKKKNNLDDEDPEQ